LFRHQGDKSELRGATSNFLPQYSTPVFYQRLTISCARLLTRKFHRSFRNFWIYLLFYSNFFKRIVLSVLRLLSPATFVIAGFLRHQDRSALLVLPPYLSATTPSYCKAYSPQERLLLRPKVLCVMKR